MSVLYEWDCINELVVYGNRTTDKQEILNRKKIRRRLDSEHDADLIIQSSTDSLLRSKCGAYARAEKHT